MKKLVRIGKIIILAVAFIVVAFPFFWCLMLSFKSNAEIMSIPTTFFPSEWIVSGYKKVLTEAPFMTWLWNSLFSSVVSTAIVVFTSCLGGYIFGKFNFYVSADYTFHGIGIWNLFVSSICGKHSE